MVQKTVKETPPCKDDFLKILGTYKEYCIFPHVNPDPDALSSALAFQYLLRHLFSVNAPIILVGHIGREENKTLIKECSINMKLVDEVKIKNSQCIILLDTQHTHGNAPLPKGIVPDVVFDHHPHRKTSFKVPYTDIRPSFGSTSTIVYEYLKHFSVKINRKLATALIYGIKTDTANFTRGVTENDFTSYYELTKKSDGRSLARIERPPLPIEYYEAIHRALERMFRYENILSVNLRDITSSDYTALIADFFLSFHQAEWVLVTGVLNDKMFLSLRNKHGRKEAGEIMRTIIGTKGSGGGHKMSAGGFIKLESVNSEFISKLERDIVSRLLTRIKGKISVGELFLHRNR